MCIYINWLYFFGPNVYITSWGSWGGMIFQEKQKKGAMYCRYLHLFPLKLIISKKFKITKSLYFITKEGDVSSPELCMFVQIWARHKWKIYVITDYVYSSRIQGAPFKLTGFLSKKVAVTKKGLHIGLSVFQTCDLVVVGCK